MVAENQNPTRPDRTSKAIRWTIRTAAIAAVVIIVVTLLVSTVVPIYVQSRLIPDLVDKFGLSADRIQIRRIGLGGIDAGPVMLTVKDRPALKIDAVYIDYSPLSLVRGNIKGISISGLHTAVDIQDDGVTVAGLTLPAPDQQAASPSKKQPGRLPALNTLIPIELDYVNIHNAVIDLKWCDIPIQVPMSVDLATADLSKGRIQAEISLYPRGNPIEMRMAVNQPENRATLSLVHSRVLIESMADLTALLAPASIGGIIEMQGRLSIRMAPLTITEAGLTADLTRARIKTGAATLTNATASGTESPPVRIQADLRTMEEVAWSCGPFDIKGPVTLGMAHLQGKLMKENALWRLTSSGRMHLPAQSVTPAPYVPLTIQQGVTHTLNIDARQTAPDAIEFTLSANPLDPDAELAAGMADVMLKSRLSNVSLEGAYSQNHLKSKLTISLAELALPLPDGRLLSPVLNISADADLDLSDAGHRMNIQAAIDATDLSMVAGAARASIPDISLKADISADSSQNAENAIRINTRLKAADARFEDKSQGLNINEININLPMQWPFPRKGEKGRLDIRSIAFQKRPLGDLKADVFQQKDALIVNGRHQSKLIKNLCVSIQTRVDTAGAAVDVSIPPLDIGPETDLGQVAPEAAGFTMDGRFQAKGRMDIAPGKMSGSVSAELSDGRLQNTDLDLDLSGIHAKMQIKDLLTLRSGPGQQLRIESLRFGNIAAEQLQVDFQMEPEQTLFIEKAKMKWCQGWVNTNAVRIRPGRDIYDLTLVCDRLNLAMVLQQLGAAQGSGEGAVNGVIPVRWAKGKIHFDKGFLYSTPGQTGTIALEGTEFLLEGLPKGSPQHTQLDIATEALKDYTYNWAKLSLESDQDILLIKLQLDGKPNRLLPFGYDKNIGTLMRVTGKGQAEFKGINIDLNFKSPINEILNFQEFIKNKNR